ncbi:MAG: hypothetical protein ACK4N5_06740, partial [Myxococcales bacterium]
KREVVSVLGGIRIDPRAEVTGNRVAIGFNPLGYVPGVAGFTSGLVGRVLQFVLYFVLGLLMLAFFPNRVRVVGRELLRAPAMSFGIGFAGSIGVVVLIPLMIATVIGIPLIPVLLFGVVGAVVLGFTALSLEIGERLTHRKASALALAIGSAALCVVSALPFLLGFLLLWGLSVVVFGAALRTRLGSGSVNDARFSPLR